MIHLTMSIKKKSAWYFKTCGGAGLSIGVVSATGGWIILGDPSQTEIRFDYGGIGGGWAWGIKLPKIKSIKINTRAGELSGVASPSSFKSVGEILITTSFSRDELSRSDIQGLCAFIEAGAGLIGGGYGTVMLLGLDPLLLAIASMPGGMTLLLNSAKGMLLMSGVNVGLQAGIGIAGYFGYLH